MPKKTVKGSKPTTIESVNKNLPSSVKIGYRNIQIKYVRPDFKSDDMTESYGEYRAREGLILLQHDLCGQEMANSLWHEIKHAAVYVSGLNQANDLFRGELSEKHSYYCRCNCSYAMGIRCFNEFSDGRCYKYRRHDKRSSKLYRQ